MSHLGDKLVGEKANIINVNIEDYNLEANKYDIVLAFNLLEHLKEPQSSLNNIYESLHENGYLIGSVPNNSV